MGMTHTHLKDEVIKMDSQKIVSAIIDHVSIRGGQQSSWYVGIAANARKRLFDEHNVREEKGKWIYKTADNSQEARDAESTLLDYGFDGGPGGGDESTNQVYAYLKTQSTRE